MPTQYDMLVRILDPKTGFDIDHVIKRYGDKIFTNRETQKNTPKFLREDTNYSIGEIIIISAIDEETAKEARKTLGRIEGLVVEDITESEYEENRV